MKSPYAILLLSQLLSLCYSCTYNNKEIVGVYVNNFNESLNKEKLPHESPKCIDTLSLFKDGKFYSKGFGHGIYKIYVRNGYNKINLIYENLESGYEMTISKKKWYKDEPVLEIDVDGIYFYRKIN